MSIIVKVVSKMVKVVSRTFGHLGGEGVVCEVGYGYIAGGRGGVHDGEGDIVMVRVMSLMLDMLSLMVGVVSMTAEENVWESGEEKMTLLPEAVGAGMWKPEYEFPGMHSTTRPSQAQLPCKDTRTHKDAKTHAVTYIDICTQLHMQKQSHVSAKLKPRAGKAATQCVTLDVHSNKRTAERHRDTKSDSLVVKYPLTH